MKRLLDVIWHRRVFIIFLTFISLILALPYYAASHPVSSIFGIGPSTDTTTTRTIDAQGNITGTTITQTQHGAKTYWDLAQLILVSLVLALGGYWFNQQEKKRDQEREDKRIEETNKIEDRRIQEAKILEQRREEEARKLEADRAREAILQTYFDRMTELILERGLGAQDISIPDNNDDEENNDKKRDKVSSIAHIRTLTVLRSLDGSRVNAVRRFIVDAGLEEVFSLSGEDLREVIWAGVDLTGVNLTGTDLSKADLSKADLTQAILIDAKLTGANLTSARLFLTDLSTSRPGIGTSLVGAVLTDANLTGAVLTGANLIWANLSGALLVGANLTEADLSKADLTGATLIAVNDSDSAPSEAILTGANPSGLGGLQTSQVFATRVRKADLSGASLLEANLTGVQVTLGQLARVETLKNATMPEGIKYEEWIKRQSEDVQEMFRK